jgi:proteasome accessory factor C
VDKFDRIFALHQLFAGRRTPIRMEDIQQRLECGRATTYRLIELMRDQLGAPILKDPDTGGLLYQRSATDDLYELPGLWFSAAELQALLVFQRLLHSLEPGLLENHLAPLGRKLDALHRAPPVKPFASRPAPPCSVCA